jgi:hypothetical protein
MHARRLAPAAALVAAAFGLAACSNVSMPSMPGMPSVSTPAVPNAPAMPGMQMPAATAPNAPAMPAMPAMPSAPQLPPAAQQAAQGAQAAQAQGMIIGNLMSATLLGAKEVPPNSSTGSGVASIKLDGDVLSWVITYSGMSGPVTDAHFHGPAAPGANAAVIVPFAGSLGSPIAGSQKLTAAQIAGLRSGLWYVNLHSAAFPGGEIRGQVTAAQ